MERDLLPHGQEHISLLLGDGLSRWMGDREGRRSRSQMLRSDSIRVDWPKKEGCHCVGSSGCIGPHTDKGRMKSKGPSSSLSFLSFLPHSHSLSPTLSLDPLTLPSFHHTMLRTSLFSASRALLARQSKAATASIAVGQLAKEGRDMKDCARKDSDYVARSQLG